MKIAIHHRPGSFSDRWIQYCEENKISFKIVNCYDSDIVAKVKDCDVILWHHSQTFYKDVLFAKQLLFSLQKAGKIVFPDFDTAWHFDDKLGQKYLFEAVGAELVPSYVFYTKDEAIEWINSTTFPKVFKLRGGASSSNVKLVKTKSDALRFTKIAFTCGFSQFDRFGNLKERIRKYKEGKVNFVSLLKAVARLFVPTEFSKMHGREKGYVYFQDFIADNDHDIRIIVIGDKAFGLKRMNRDNDFRASGSGKIIYDESQIPIETVKLSFEYNKKLNAQCVAFDYIFGNNKEILLTEISYGFVQNAYNNCNGYWDENLLWHKETFIPEYFMLDDIVKKLRMNSKV
ncbi:MAG: ATP-grasp domain-containing protein [Bacteroidales bacterium]